MKKLLALAVLCAALFGTWYFASPWLALKGMRDAAQDMDRAELERRIDFPAVRASLKPQLQAAIRDEAGRGGNALGQVLGRVAAGAVSDRAVELAVTPGGMASLITTGAMISPLLPEQLKPRDVNWGVERDGLNAFRAIGTADDGAQAPVLVFARDGLGWRLVAVELPVRG